MSIQLKILTPDGICFDSLADSVIVRTITGNVGVNGDHSNYFSIIASGLCIIEENSKKRYAAVDDGYISVQSRSIVKIVVTTFEWSEHIDLRRAEAAYKNSLLKLETLSQEDVDYSKAKRKLARAENRQMIAQKYIRQNEDKNS